LRLGGISLEEVSFDERFVSFDVTSVLMFVLSFLVAAILRKSLVDLRRISSEPQGKARVTELRWRECNVSLPTLTWSTWFLDQKWKQSFARSGARQELSLPIVC
jgi:hypothetical protein